MLARLSASAQYIVGAGKIGGLSKPAPNPNFLIDAPEKWVRSTLTFVGECSILIWESAQALFRRPREVGETLSQMAFIGINSVPIVALTTFAYGAVLGQYSADILKTYGATSLAGLTVSLTMARELAPVIAGIMVAARCGSAMAAQIGTMAVTEQLDALRSLNVPPVNYLVLPRLVAAATMLPMLGLIGFFAGCLGGYLVAVMMGGVGHGEFLSSIQQYLKVTDVGYGLVKTAVFGFLTGVVSCQQGLRAKGGAVAVGTATTRTVVLTMVMIYVLNYFMTDMFFRTH